MNPRAIIAFVAGVLQLFLWGALIIGVLASLTGQMPYWAPLYTVLAVGCTGIAITSWIGSTAKQVEREIQAGRIANAILRDERVNAPVGLFLRPFSTDFRYVRAEKTSWTDPTLVLEAESARDASFERYLMYKFSKATTRLTPLAIGDPREDYYGFGKVATDDTGWQDLVRKLINRADLIFLVVGASGGTAWEIEEVLRSASLGKTVFIALPARWSNDKSAAAIEKLRDDYSVAASRLLAMGLIVPEYRDGLAFHFSSAEVACATFDIHRGEIDKLLRSIAAKSERERLAIA